MNVNIKMEIHVSAMKMIIDQLIHVIVCLYNNVIMKTLAAVINLNFWL